MTEMIDELDFIRIKKYSAMQKAMSRQLEAKPHQEKIFAKDTFDKKRVIQNIQRTQIITRK